MEECKGNGERKKERQGELEREGGRDRKREREENP